MFTPESKKIKELNLKTVAGFQTKCPHKVHEYILIDALKQTFYIH